MPAFVASTSSAVAAEIALAHLLHRPRQRRHDRGDGDARDRRRVDVRLFEEPRHEDAELVGGPLAQRRQAPVVHEALAVEDANGHVRVADVNG